MVFEALREAVRAVRKSPGLSGAAVATFALGVGATSTVVSVADAVLVAPLPYADEARLIRVWEARPSDPVGSAIVPANLERYRLAASISSLAGVTRRSFTLTGDGPPQQLRAEMVTCNFFDMLGVWPSPGRTFRPEEQGARVAILSNTLWRSRYAGDPAVLGRSIRLNDEPYQVVGVMPASFQPLSRLNSGFSIDIFVPAPLELLAVRDGLSISAFARLADGASLAQARAELEALSRQPAAAVPRLAGFTAQAAPLRDTIVDEVRLPLLVLLAAAALVLLVACVNVANLLLVRAIDMERQTAIRLALGATRLRIVLELAARGVVLGAAGGALGIAASVWARDAALTMVPATFPVVGDPALNWRVLVASVGLAIAAGAVAGFLPAVSVGRDPAPALQADGRTASGSRRAARWRGVLMAAQIAAAIALAVGAGLLVRSFAALTAIELGWDPNVLLMSLRPPPSRYPTEAARGALYDRVQRTIAAVPGVESVAFASEFPLRGGSYTAFAVGGEVLRAGVQSVSASYFDALRIPLRRGRRFTGADRDGAPLVAIVSESVAQHFPGDVIDGHFTRDKGVTPITVVGVVADIRREGREARVRPQVYFPAAQSSAHDLRLDEVIVRSAGDVSALLPEIQRAIWSVDRDQPVTNVMTLSGAIAEMAKGRRFNLTLLGALAVIALVLALVGVYGVVAHAARLRTREIGIRVALGATRAGVIRLVVSSSAVWIVLGLALGLAGAVAAARVLSSLLFQVSPYDPVAFVSATIATTAVALAASYAPARRAARVDPLVALRS